MGQALYRKYRSRSFDEVVGQDHITKTLQNAIKQGRISHAYLFTGPRGVGKTSVARILAYAVNGLDYENEGTHLDIIEIDAASNRRIDEIRDLRDKVHISPTSAKYKVYIIDEVHMLTREAFNALLKTLEEPPEHAIFILATTEAHKLPDTIISRTQRHNFKAVDTETAASHLAKLAKAEKIEIDEDALKLLARFGEGSFRDSISLLDQVASSGEPVTVEQVRRHLGLPADDVADRLLANVDAGDARSLLDNLTELRDQAIDAASLAKILADKLRQAIATGDITKIQFLRELLEVPASHKPFDSLELTLLAAAAEAGPTPTKPKTAAVEADVPKTETKAERATPPATTKKPTGSAASLDSTKWQAVLDEVKAKAPAVYTALRLALPQFGEDKLTLAFEFPLHQKKVNLAANKNVVATAIESVYGVSVQLECISDKAAFSNSSPATETFISLATDSPAEAADNSSLQTINNIFGSAEMLES